MGTFTKNIDQETVKKIDSMTMRILKEKGIRFVNQKAREVFAENGFEVKGEIVYFREDQVRKAVEMAPKSFVLHGREEKYDLHIGGGDTAFVPAYGPVFVQRHDKRRVADHEDVVNIQKLTQSSDVINVMNPYAITASDIEEGDIQMYNQACCLKYGAKPVMALTGGYEQTKESIALIKKANQKNPEDVVTIGLISALSPLGYADNMSQALFAFAEEGQAIILGCGALPGATSSVSLTGTMVTATAELLAGVTLAQLIHPGLPCVFGNVAAGTDLRYVIPTIGGPEAAILVAVSKAMSEFYGIPCRGGGSVCDAKQMDYEAGAESTMVMMATMEAGVDYVIHAAGILDSYNAIGYEKFIMDEQNIRAISFMQKGLNLEEEAVGLDTILEVPHSEQYLATDHTLDYMEDELYMPPISLHGFYEMWEKNGRKTLEEQANEVIDKRLEDYKLPALSEEAQKEVDHYLKIKCKER